MLVDRGLGGLHVETGKLAADRPVGIDAAEHDVGVGDGRLGAAAAAVSPLTLYALRAPSL